MLSLAASASVERSMLAVDRAAAALTAAESCSARMRLVVSPAVAVEP